MVYWVRQANSYVVGLACVGNVGFKRTVRLGSPPHNLTGLYNLTVFLLHKLVLNVRKVESNMAAFCKDILSGPRPLFYLVLVLFYFLLIDY